MEISWYLATLIISFLMSRKAIKVDYYNGSMIAWQFNLTGTIGLLILFLIPFINIISSVILLLTVLNQYDEKFDYQEFLRKIFFIRKRSDESVD